MKNLIEALRECELEPRVEGIFIDSMEGKNPVYVAEFGEHKLQFINSSNQERLDEFDGIQEHIAELLEENEIEGDLHDSVSGNEIYWELVSIDSNGSLLKKK